MIDLYWWDTSNGRKAAIALEEMELEYCRHAVDITAGEQHADDFLRISPNGRIPGIVDRAPAFGGAPMSVFESGAILIYLAEKAGRFLPEDPRERSEVLQWLMWQTSGFGPMLGQLHHFVRHAPPSAVYGRERYAAEARRLYDVLDRRLQGRDWVCDAYSIADMMIFPWTLRHPRQGIDLAVDFPNVFDYMNRVRDRPAVRRALAQP